MASGVSGPGGSDPTSGSPSEDIPQLQTGMSYKASPGFKKWLENWFPGQVTDQMVTAFENNMMQMIQNSMNQSKAQHEKVQQQIKQRIKEG